MKSHLRLDTSLYGRITPACHLKGGREHGTVVLDPHNFRWTGKDQRCMKCEAIYVKRRNEQRAEKGLPPVGTIEAKAS